MTDQNEWPAPDYWCTICDRGAEGCLHTPDDAAALPGTDKEN